MKKFICIAVLITIGIMFMGTNVYAEMAKEGSGAYRSAKTGKWEVLAMG